jgi:hypothetical protein
MVHEFLHDGAEVARSVRPSKRNRKRQEEYDRLPIEHETHGLD